MRASAEPLLRLDRVAKSFGDAPAVSDAEVLLELAEEAGDAATRLEAAEKLARTERDLDSAELRQLLGGEHDASSAIVSINAGAGGTDAADWAQMLFRMYTRLCERKSWSYTVLDLQAGDEAGLKAATIEVNAEYAYGFLKSESGVHRLVRISPFDAAKRRHTSFTSVFVFPQIDDTITVDIKDDDLRVDTFRASGAGGQHVNKTESAIRVTHLPTGIVVECQDSRSQHKNREKALSVLAARIKDQQMREQQAKTASTRKSLIGSGDRSERIRTYNFPQGRVTDHRINLTLYKIDRIMDGELDELIDGLTAEHQAEQLASLAEAAA